MFAHLHVHTEYSLADSSLKIGQLVKKTKELGMDSIAITDHGVLFGVVHFYKECKKHNIKPIIGIEAYVAPRRNVLKEGNLDDANYHLVLLAENNEGLQNLRNVASNASLEGFYYKPRTDKDFLRKNCKGLIALSACLGGEVQHHLLQNNYEKAKNTAIMYNNLFGQGNFYLELQNHGIRDQLFVNNKLIDISRETGIPLVCTNDCHYLTKDDSRAHDILMAIQAKTTITDTKRKMYEGSEFYLKSPEEMVKIFGYIPEAIENTSKIAKRCSVTMEFGKNKIPHFDIPEGYTKRQYIEDLVYVGARELYKTITHEISDRIQYELNTIEKMGFIDYFLIVWDFIRYARENDILVGPGRGSASGSIVSYCLKITRINPLRYDLLFERFLDFHRISMPDYIYCIVEPIRNNRCLSLVNSIT